MKVTQRFRRLGLDAARAMLILLACCGAGLAVNAARSPTDPTQPQSLHGLPLIAEREYEFLVPCTELASPAMPVSPTEAIALHGGNTLFVDARDLSRYIAGHVSGAVHVPFDDNLVLDGVPADTARRFRRFETVVVYGDPPESDDVGRAELLAGQLQEKGVADARYLPQGLPAFQQAGGAIATGAPGPLPDPGLDVVTFVVLAGCGLLGIALVVLLALRRAWLRAILPYLAVPARLGLAAVFAIAAWHKILDPESFALNIAAYEILPLALVNLMAICLPWLEMGCALLLVIGWQSRPAALATIGMNLMFMTALAWGIERGMLSTTCGCFASKSVENEVNWATFLRDVGFLALGLYVYVFGRMAWGLDRWLERRRERRTGA